MSIAYYYYLVPEIYPVFPQECGDTVIVLNLQDLFDRAAARHSAANISILAEMFCDGELVSSDTWKSKLDLEGKIDRPLLELNYSHPKLAYVSISIEADAPLFVDNKPEPGYAQIARSDGNSFPINPQFKAAVGIIIDQLRETQKFSLVYQAHYFDDEREIGNSLLLINPYTGPIVVSMSTGSQKIVRERLAPQSAKMFPIDSVIEKGKMSCVMYTANNRFLGWDVRHVFGDTSNIYRVDHFEYYRAIQTLREGTFGEFAKSNVRRFLNRLGLYN